MSLNSLLEQTESRQEELEKKGTNAFKIKIFDPVPNKNWLETTVNTWFKENSVDVISVNMNYTGDKYLLTLIYREVN